jgi:hypothetical protein
MMSKKIIVLVLSTLLFLSSLFGFIQPAFAIVKPTSEIHLFTSEEWKTLVATNPSAVGEKILVELNAYRDLIGKDTLKIIHPSDNVKYRRTDSVFVSPRDGGGYVYGFLIHWFRNVALGVGKDLTTKIAWEIVDNQHYQAKVFEDDSLFQPINPELLNQFFRDLIPSS